MTFDEIKAIVGQCSYLDWEFRVLEKGDGFLVQVRFHAPDSFKPGAEPTLQSCRKWYVSSHASKDEVVRTCWKAIEAAVLHEAQEAFKYRGVPIYNPHLDPDHQVQVRQKILSRRTTPDDLEYSEVRTGPSSIWS